MKPQTVTEIVRVDELRAYLAAHGLRVVRGGWRWGDKRPYLILGPELPAKANTNEEKGETDAAEERDQ